MIVIRPVKRLKIINYPLKMYFYPRKETYYLSLDCNAKFKVCFIKNTLVCWKDKKGSNQVFDGLIRQIFVYNDKSFKMI